MITQLTTNNSYFSTRCNNLNLCFTRKINSSVNKCKLFSSFLYVHLLLSIITPSIPYLTLSFLKRLSPLTLSVKKNKTFVLASTQGLGVQGLLAYLATKSDPISHPVSSLR